MAKVDGPLSVVKVCMSENRVSVHGGPLSVVKVFAQIWHPKSTPYYFSLPIILSATHSLHDVQQFSTSARRELLTFKKSITVTQCLTSKASDVSSSPCRAAGPTAESASPFLKKLRILNSWWYSQCQSENHITIHQIEFLVTKFWSYTRNIIARMLQLD